MNNLKVKICAVPFYRRDQYDLLRNVSVDKETFSKSYEETMANVELKHHDMEKKGFRVVSISVDIEELLKWANSLDVMINPESRTKFIMKKLKEMISNGSITI